VFAERQVMKASFWCFLEVILVGSLMLYSTASLHYNFHSHRQFNIAIEACTWWTVTNENS